jgi:HK97 family phage prohead protease
MKASEEVNDEDQKVGVIEGYASTYGNTDLGGDVVEKGAFKQTLKHKGGIVPLLLDHGYKTQDVAGLAILEDDEKGLYMKAEMPLDIPEIQNAYRKIKFMIDRGGKMGLSIGYDTVKAMPGDDGVRKLKELALHEVSITPFPMNTEAQIMAAKARKKSAVKSSVTRRKAVTISRGKTSTDKPKQTTNLRRAK